MVPKSRITSVPALLAHARAMEQEAHDRYLDLAEQLEVHHNPEVAKLFREMAYVEAMHVKKIVERAGAMELPRLAPWDFQWPDQQAPEVATGDDVHYMMTPHHALAMALRAEERAEAFYAAVVDATDDAGVRELALELRDEEREHVELMAKWLAKYPEPDDDWDHDLDPPTLQE